LPDDADEREDDVAEASLHTGEHRREESITRTTSSLTCADTQSAAEGRVQDGAPIIAEDALRIP